MLISVQLAGTAPSSIVSDLLEQAAGKSDETIDEEFITRIAGLMYLGEWLKSLDMGDQKLTILSNEAGADTVSFVLVILLFLALRC